MTLYIVKLLFYVAFLLINFQLNAIESASEIEVRNVRVDILPPNTFIVQWKTFVNGIETNLFAETNVSAAIDGILVYDGPTTFNIKVLNMPSSIVPTKIYYFEINFKLVYLQENQEQILSEIKSQFQYQHLPVIEKIEFEKNRDSLFSPSNKCRLKFTLNTTISKCNNIDQLFYEISQLDGTIASKQRLTIDNCTNVYTYENIIQLQPNKIYTILVTQSSAVLNSSLYAQNSICETDPFIQLIDQKLESLKIDDSFQYIQLSHPIIDFPANRRVFYWVFLLQSNANIANLVESKDKSCPNSPYCTFLTAGRRYNSSKIIQIKENANSVPNEDTDYYFFRINSDLKSYSLVLLYAIYPTSAQRSVQYFQGMSNILYVSSPNYPLSIAMPTTQSSTTVAITTLKIDTTTTHNGLLDYEIGIICAFVAFVVIGVVVGGIIFYMKRKRFCRKRWYRENREENDRKMTSLVTSPPTTEIIEENHIPPAPSIIESDYKCDVSKVEEFWLKKHADSNLKFEKEYQKLPDYRLVKSMQTANLYGENKNRFNDVKPYDETRVVLKDNVWESGVNFDYINANFVSGYSSDKKFIATQGPMKSTVADFWHMVVQCKSNAIVMLANLFENEKERCAQYWPEEVNQSVSYGDYEVTLTKCSKVRDYVKRTLEVQPLKNKQEKPLVVSQYFYPQWPDRDRPTDCMSVLHLISDVNRRHSLNPNPVVVHCSAGVGRTGTYITLDAMLEQIRKENKFNVFAFVSKIREQRQSLVQNSNQYVFIHEAIYEYIKFGFTDVKKANVHSYCKERLQKPGLLEAEFQKLNSLNTSKALKNEASKASRKNLNRDRNIVCYDENRVKLSSLHGISYINATRILGHNDENTFIITQDPLSNTIFEFWKMISEYKCEIIVCLNRDYLKEDAVYFPVDQEKTKVVEHDGLKFTITALENHNQSKININLREFEVISAKHFETKTFKVTQFIFNEHWAENEAPSNCSAFLDLISQVHLINAKSPIVVHANAGGSNCSVLCALSILLQQLKTGEYVDICRTVKKLKSQRSHMIQSLNQYKFLYQCLYDYTKTPNENSKA